MYSPGRLIEVLCDGDLVLVTNKDWVRELFTLRDLILMYERDVCE